MAAGRSRCSHCCKRQLQVACVTSSLHTSPPSFENQRQEHLPLYTHATIPPCLYRPMPPSTHASNSTCPLP